MRGTRCVRVCECVRCVSVCEISLRLIESSIEWVS